MKPDLFKWRNMNKNGTARRAPLLCAAPRKADKAAAAYTLFASKTHPGAVQKESYPRLMH